MDAGKLTPLLLQELQGLLTAEPPFKSLRARTKISSTHFKHTLLRPAKGPTFKFTSVNTAAPNHRFWSYYFIIHKPSLLAPYQAGCPRNPPPSPQGAAEQAARAENGAHAPRPREAGFHAVYGGEFVLPLLSLQAGAGQLSHHVNRIELYEHSALPGSHGKHILYAPLTSPQPHPGRQPPFPTSPPPLGTLYSSNRFLRPKMATPRDTCGHVTRRPLHLRPLSA